MIELPTRPLVHAAGVMTCALVVMARFVDGASLGYLPTATDDFASATAADPRLGENANRDEVAKGFGGVALIVVVFADCSECSAKKFDDYRKFARRQQTQCIAMVMRDTSARIASGQNLAVVPCDDTVSRHWNAVFQPRVYAIDCKGDFVYIQPFDVSFVDALLQGAAAVNSDDD